MFDISLPPCRYLIPSSGANLECLASFSPRHTRMGRPSRHLSPASPPVFLFKGAYQMKLYYQRGFDIGRVQSCFCVFQNIDPPPPFPPGECVLPPQQRRGVHTRRAERGVGGSIFCKTQDIGLASYSNNLSTYITVLKRVSQQAACS
jgi:hypothetical protein